MTAFEKLHLFAVAARPAMLDLIFFLQCLLGFMAVLGIVVIYAFWRAGNPFSGKSAREAAIRAQANQEPGA